MYDKQCLTYTKYRRNQRNAMNIVMTGNDSAVVPAGDWSPWRLGLENVLQQDPSRHVLGRIHLDVKKKTDSKTGRGDLQNELWVVGVFRKV